MHLQKADSLYFDGR